MHPVFVARGQAAQPIPICFVTGSNDAQVRAGLEPAARAFAAAAGFEPHAGRHLLLPSGAGAPDKLSGVLFGLEAADKRVKDLFLPGRLPALLPAGTYRFANSAHDQRLAALAFALGSYRFNRYRKAEDKVVKLELPDGVDGDDLTRIMDGVTLARDLINTPANDLGPAELEEAARALAAKHGASIRSIVGDDLLANNFPLIHAGGLDIKPESGMLIMKKDMGGAACTLALAHMIMDARLPVRLRVLIPAVENAISGGAFRPLDVYTSRKGITVEIGNTDAEGRLILADALALGDEEGPDLMVDMATLTGAARVALGPELPPFYTDDEALAADLAGRAAAENDPLWRMPLWRPYESLLDSKTADINNVSSGNQGGSITAALFLSRFVAQAKAWVHLDVYAWVPSAKSARPEGGECQAARALYALIKARHPG